MANTYTKHERIILHHKIQVSGFYCCSTGHMSTAHPAATCRNPPSQRKQVYSSYICRGRGVALCQLEENSVQLAPATTHSFSLLQMYLPYFKNRSVQSALFNFYSCLQVEFIVMIEKSMEFIICL